MSNIRYQQNDPRTVGDFLADNGIARSMLTTEDRARLVQQLQQHLQTARSDEILRPFTVNGITVSGFTGWDEVANVLSHLR